MTQKHLFFITFMILLTALANLQIDNSLPWLEQLHLLFNAEQAESFADFNFVYAQLPRVIVTVLVGAMLGLVGSLMQQLTQNSLTSPLTLGTSSGAWLALIIVNIWFPNLIADHSAFAAMAGALLAFAFIVLIAGSNNMTGMPLVISGMVVNILLGSIATAIILLNQQYAQNVFMWGAGDLAQNGWDWVVWLLPRILISILILLFAPRVLTLLRLGQQGATARGLSVVPIFLVCMTIGIWLVSASITAVGLIGFIGLLTPNIARILGARTAKMELYASLLLGALLLLLTDMLSMILSLWLEQSIPSGVTAAAIGAPALIWFSRRQLTAQDNLSIRLPFNRAKLSVFMVTLLALGLFLAIALHVLFQISDAGWFLSLPSDYQWPLRWPRALTALSAGVGLAIAGCILQRIIYNPLASPDILGVSAGATFMLVFCTLFLGQSLFVLPWITALLGSLLVLFVLILLGRRNQYHASSLILTGIAVTALLQAFVQFFLAKGNQDSYRILQWLAGSTYRVTELQAQLLFAVVFSLLIVALASSRWLTMISISRSFADARGLSSEKATLILLVVVALLCAIVTATMGPVSFVGLIAPHMAIMLGAHRVKSQLILASLVGGTLMLWADWIGQVALFPMQIAAGTLVAMIGALYFLTLLISSRLKGKNA